MINIFKNFKFKNFISFTILLLFIIILFSAVALYMRPEGSIALWIGWKFLGLSKENWEGIHTIISILFVTFVSIHFFLNIKVFIHYLKNKVNGVIKLQKEFFMSAIMVFVFLFISIWQVQPVWKVHQWRLSLKKRAYLVKTKPPQSDFDQKNLLEIAKILNTSIEEVLKNMRQHNFVVQDTSDILSNIAKKNKTSPEEIYIKLLSKP